MGRTRMAVVYGGALGKSLHGDRTRGIRQTEEQNRRLAGARLRAESALPAFPSGEAEAEALSGQS